MSRNFKSVAVGETLRNAIVKINESTLGMVVQVDHQGRFMRTVTDGDIRRALVDGLSLESDIGGLREVTSVTLDADATPRAILKLMDERRIDQIPLLDAEGRVVEVVHRRDVHAPILLSTPHIGDDELFYVREAFETNWIAPLGPNVDAFEQELAQIVQSPAACALSSGTAALHVGLRLLGVGAGDTVFVSDFTFIASVNPILYLGATPVLVDSDYESWNMSPLALERAFEAARRSGRLPKAVLAVNLYGQSADYDPLLEICDTYGVPLIEDAAESLGAMYKGRPSGTLGRLGCYSFNGNKIITTSGGGMLVGHDAEMIARARYLSSQARQPFSYYEHTEIGYNYRMSNILAGIGRGQLKVLNQRIDRRRQINELYRAGFSDLDSVQFMPEPEWSFSNRWLSSIVLGDDKSSIDIHAIIRRINENLVEVRHLWKPMHMQPLFQDADRFDTGNHSVSADLFRRGVCLPSGSNMTDDQVAHVIATVRKCLVQSGL